MVVPVAGPQAALQADPQAGSRAGLLRGALTEGCSLRGVLTIPIRLSTAGSGGNHLGRERTVQTGHSFHLSHTCVHTDMDILRHTDMYTQHAYTQTSRHTHLWSCSVRAPSALGCGQHPPKGCATGRERWPFSPTASQDYSEAEAGSLRPLPPGCPGRGGWPPQDRPAQRQGRSQL